MTDPVEDDLKRMPPEVKEDRRKHGYAVLEDKLDEEIRKIRKILWRFIAVFAVTGLVAAFFIGLNLLRQSDTSDDIQDQRFNSLVTSCNEQNKRHDETVRRIRISDTDEASKKLRIFLVDSLQPRIEDCEANAKRRVMGG